MNGYQDLSREQLLGALDMFARMWLAHDGCWFLAAEAEKGLDGALELDRQAWEKFAAVEARRIKRFADLGDDGGLEALEKALSLRMYALLNEQHTEWGPERRTLRFFMDSCRVHAARERKNLPPFPCKSIGETEFPTFAATVDARIKTRCLRCPPDAPAGMYCGWEFYLEE